MEHLLAAVSSAGSIDDISNSSNAASQPAHAPALPSASQSAAAAPLTVDAGQHHQQGSLPSVSALAAQHYGATPSYYATYDQHSPASAAALGGVSANASARGAGAGAAHHHLVGAHQQQHFSPPAPPSSSQIHSVYSVHSSTAPSLHAPNQSPSVLLQQQHDQHHQQQHHAHQHRHATLPPPSALPELPTYSPASSAPYALPTASTYATHFRQQESSFGPARSSSSPMSTSSVTPSASALASPPPGSSSSSLPPGVRGTPEFPLIPKRRRRTTPQELAVLEDEFRSNSLPNVKDRERIAALVGMNARAVQIWFQNRRQKEKKDQGGKSTADSADGASSGAYEGRAESQGAESLAPEAGANSGSGGAGDSAAPSDAGHPTSEGTNGAQSYAATSLSFDAVPSSSSTASAAMAAAAAYEGMSEEEQLRVMRIERELADSRRLLAAKRARSGSSSNLQAGPSSKMRRLVSAPSYPVSSAPTMPSIAAAQPPRMTTKSNALRLLGTDAPVARVSSTLPFPHTPPRAVSMPASLIPRQRPAHIKQEEPQQEFSIIQSGGGRAKIYREQRRGEAPAPTMTTTDNSYLWQHLESDPVEPPSSDIVFHADAAPSSSSMYESPEYHRREQHEARHAALVADNEARDVDGASTKLCDVDLRRRKTQLARAISSDLLAGATASGALDDEALATSRTTGASDSPAASESVHDLHLRRPQPQGRVRANLPRLSLPESSHSASIRGAPPGAASRPAYRRSRSTADIAASKGAQQQPQPQQRTKPVALIRGARRDPLLRSASLENIGSRAGLSDASAERALMLAAAQRHQRESASDLRRRQSLMSARSTTSSSDEANASLVELASDAGSLSTPPSSSLSSMDDPTSYFDIKPTFKRHSQAQRPALAHSRQRVPGGGQLTRSPDDERVCAELLLGLQAVS